MASQRKKGAFLGYANIVVKNIVNLLYTPMLLAFVGQAEYGVFQTANNFIFSLQLLAFGFSGAYVRFFTLRIADNDVEGVQKLNGMYLLLYIGISLVALMCGLGFAAGSSMFFSEGFTTQETKLASEIMTVMAVNISLTLLSTVFDAFIIAHERFAFQQSRQMFVSLASPALALGFLYCGAGVVGVATAQLIVTVVLLLLNIRYSIAKLAMRFQFRGINGSMFCAIAAFSGWLFLNQIFDIITLNVPSVILGATAGATAVAVFSIAASLRTVFYSLSTTISSLFIPLANRVVAETNDNNQLTQLMTKVGRYQALILWWVLGGFTVVGRWFISIWAGSEFDEAYWLTLVMVLAASVPLIQNIGIEIQKAKNKHKARSVVYLAASIIDLALTLFLAHNLGAWAAVLGYVAYIVLASWLFMNWYYHCRIGLSMGLFWKQALPIIAVSVAATIVSLLGTTIIPVDSLLDFLGWGLVYSALFAGGQWMLALNSEEKSQFRETLGKLKRKRNEQP